MKNRIAYISKMRDKHKGDVLKVEKYYLTGIA